LAQSRENDGSADGKLIAGLGGLLHKKKDEQPAPSNNTKPGAKPAADQHVGNSAATPPKNPSEAAASRNVKPNIVAPVFAPDAALISVLRDLDRSLGQPEETEKIENVNLRAVLDQARQILSKSLELPDLQADRIVRAHAGGMNTEAWAPGEVKLADGSRGSLAAVWAKRENGLINVTIAGESPDTRVPNGRTMGQFVVVLSARSPVSKGMDIQTQSEVNYWVGKLNAISIECDCAEPTGNATASDTMSDVKKKSPVILGAVITDRAREYLAKLQASQTKLPVPQPTGETVADKPKAADAPARPVRPVRDALVGSAPGSALSQSVEIENGSAANGGAPSQVEATTSGTENGAARPAPVALPVPSTATKVAAQMPSPGGSAPSAGTDATGNAPAPAEVATTPASGSAPSSQDAAPANPSAPVSPGTASLGAPTPASQGATPASASSPVAHSTAAASSPAPGSQATASASPSAPASREAGSANAPTQIPSGATIASSASPAASPTVVGAGGPDTTLALEPGTESGGAPDADTPMPEVAPQGPTPKLASAGAPSSPGWNDLVPSGEPIPETIRQPSASAHVDIPDRAVAGQLMTASVVNSQGACEPCVELTFNSGVMQTDVKGAAVYMVPEDSTPGRTLSIMLAARPDGPIATVDVLQPLSVSSEQEPPKVDRVLPSAFQNQNIIIDGHNFDGFGAHNHVLIDARTDGRVLAASPVQLKVQLPSGMASGVHSLVVNIGEMRSNLVCFKFVAPPPRAGVAPRYLPQLPRRLR
jgi:hypothetical protein